jgi:TonB family protein
MRLRDASMTVAMCASLLVHGAIAIGMLRRYARDRIYIPAAARPELSSIIPVAAGDPDTIFGAADGRGNAANAFDDAGLFAGRLGDQEQAFLSRDPVGPGKIGDEPSDNVLPQGDGGDGAKPGRDRKQQDAIAQVLQTQPHTERFGMATDAAQARLPAMMSVRPNSTAANSSDTGTGQGGTPGLPIPAADPAPPSDSESDAFSKTGSVAVSSGKVEARLGRKVKTVRPRLSIAARYDLMGLNFPRLVLRAHVDPTGRVEKVDVVRSTGSTLVDHEVKLAVYQWWIEPKPAVKDDVVEFGIVWR